MCSLSGMRAPIDRRPLRQPGVFDGNGPRSYGTTLARLPDIVTDVKLVERLVERAKRLQEVARWSKSRGHPGKIATLSESVA
jgi:hypothetical protein